MLDAKGGAMDGLHRLCSIILGVSLCVLVKAESHADQWTWLYYKMFSESDFSQQKNLQDIFFAKEDIPYFTQLIFSWNAHRPSKGYYSFWVQARDTATKKWGQWHKMMEWGAQVQRSFKSKSDGFSRYEHVRLEIENETGADAFRVRIAAQDGAHLKNMKAFAVSIANFSNFKTEVDMAHAFRLPSVHIKNVPMISQFALEHPRSDAICSPTSCTMLASYLLDKHVDPYDFAAKAFDKGLGVYGSWPFNMAHAFEVSKGESYFFTARLNSFARLHQRLQEGIPVAVSVRGPLKGAASAYRNGHLLLVVGWDEKNKEVICHDPAFKTHKQTVHRYHVRDFVEAWERSRRLAYIAEVKNEI